MPQTIASSRVLLPASRSHMGHMAVVALALTALLAILSPEPGDAAIVEHTFVVKDVVLRHLCEDTVITAVNGQFPGPLIEVTEGDTLKVHVLNESPYGITIHWHGIKQLLNCWADGVGMVTQCPIQPKHKFTYQFNITGQESTLWWHAHTSFLRATVHGALIIRPKGGVTAYPFPKPDKEVPIVIGEWWKANLVQVEKDITVGIEKDMNDAFSINGKLGDTYNCSGEIEETYTLEVESGSTYLLRIINAALYYEFFYKVAGHRFVVVAVDASYVNAYSTEVIVIAPGQTVDALMIANAPPSEYYMVAQVFQPPARGFKQPPQYITRGLVKYTTGLPLLNAAVMPQMPDVNDKTIAHRFYSSLTSLHSAQQPKVPLDVDEHLFLTFGFGSVCKNNQLWCPGEFLRAASINNISFQLPTKLSLLEAYYNGVEGIYTDDFPKEPLLFFNFTDKSLMDSRNQKVNQLGPTVRGTKVLKLKYNSTVEMVLQNTAIVAAVSHPLHLHGYNFFVLAQGYGNYDPEKDSNKYNLVNPQVRNTISVPTNGWAVIRFVANNPGIWYMHCHIEIDVLMGMATAIEVENGPTLATTLPTPPKDFPRCAYHDDIKAMYARNAPNKYE